MNSRIILVLAAGTAAAMQGCNDNSDTRDSGYRSDGSREATPARDGDRNDRRNSHSRPTDNAQPPMDSSQTPSNQSTWQTGERGGTTLGSTYSQPTSPAGARAVPTDSVYPAQPSQNPSNSAAASATSPEARILSILNAKDQEEIRIGRLAQERGSTEDVRNYGARLVKDHQEHVIKVASTASCAGVTLMDEGQTKQMQMTQREKGERTADRADAERSGTDRGDKATDPIAGLRSLSGVEFDRAFAMKMHEGHKKVIEKVENAQREVQDRGVKELLEKTLVTLREHERIASRLVTQTRADAER